MLLFLHIPFILFFSVVSVIGAVKLNDSSNKTTYDGSSRSSSFKVFVHIVVVVVVVVLATTVVVVVAAVLNYKKKVIYSFLLLFPAIAPLRVPLTCSYLLHIVTPTIHLFSIPVLPIYSTTSSHTCLPLVPLICASHLLHHVLSHLFSTFLVPAVPHLVLVILWYLSLCPPPTYLLPLPCPPPIYHLVCLP